MLSAINLTKKFGDLLVLDDITETIKEGERVKYLAVLVGIYPLTVLNGYGEIIQ